MSDSHYQRNDPAAEFPRTAWARGRAGYDDDFRHLVAEVITASRTPRSLLTPT